MEGSSGMVIDSAWKVVLAVEMVGTCEGVRVGDVEGEVNT